MTKNSKTKIMIKVCLADNYPVVHFGEILF
jgi:hypothetical protein